MPTVLIAGAGPTGLVMAHELARHGVQCRLIDKAADRRLTSRAIGVLPRTLEVFQLMGIAGEFLAEGNPIRGINAFNEGKRIARIALDRLESRYPFIVAIPQDQTERLLEQQLARHNVIVERDAEIVSLDQNPDDVTARVRFAGNRTVEIGCDYLVGCDGAHSTVRHLLGMPFHGGRYSKDVLLADVRVEGGFGFDEAQMFLHPAGVTLLFPIPGRRYRLIATDPRPEWGVEPTLDQCQTLINERGLNHLQLTDLQWTSTFRIAHRKVNHFRQGRVFLAGDAAHIHSPMGAQGMNAGIQDAFNLAWKLAMVATQSANPSLLDSYESERMPIDTRIIRWTDWGTRLMLSSRSMSASARNLILSNVMRFDFLRRGFTNAAAQIAVNYRESRIVEEHRLPYGPHAGDRAPDAGIRSLGNAVASRLFDLFAGTDHALLILWATDFPAQDLAQQEPFLKVHKIAEAPSPSADFIDVHGEVAAHYGVEPAAYLVRPDGYVAFRCGIGHLISLLPSYLERTFSQQENRELQEHPGPRAA
jgi:2-polyprenyl-6-methoxyphenol hydroxylase-like FAD-dependent oxidoreductase